MTLVNNRFGANRSATVYCRSIPLASKAGNLDWSLGDINRMVYGVHTALVALACIGFASLAFRLRPRLLRFAAIGLATGYAIGSVAGFVLGFLRLSLPPFQFGNVAYSGSVWLPPVFGIAGMVMGIIVAMLKNSKAA